MSPEAYLLFDLLRLSSADDSEGLHMSQVVKREASSRFHESPQILALPGACILNPAKDIRASYQVSLLEEEAHREGLDPAVGEGVTFSPPEEGRLDLRLMLLGFCLGGGMV